jgi:hypothetical protein
MTREQTRTSQPHAHVDQDEHIGAVEGDRPGDPQGGNPNAGALDPEGLPADPVAIAEDVLGANEDETQG